MDYIVGRGNESIKALLLLTEFVKVARMTETKDIISNERRTGDLQGLNRLLGSLTRKMLGKKAFAEADVLCHWQEIVGEELAAFSQPVKIDFKKGERTQGTLHIETASGAFALELQLKSKILIEKVNVFFGYEAVKALKIIQNPASFSFSKQGVHKPEKKLVTHEEETYINNLSTGLQHSELSEALQKLGCAVVANNKK